MSHIEIKRGKRTFKFHQLLANNLDKIVEQQEQDWDFKQLVSGDGMTRTGKSTLAFQMALYQDSTFADNWKDRIIFDGQKLIETAYKCGKKKVLVYDEAREGLDSKKQMEKYTQNLLDFFSQCGNLNHIVIIVLPEFFELPKTIAITQSIFLVNCYAEGFKRGYFEFHNRKSKRYLYIKGQKFLDYKSQTPSWKGTFTKYVPFDKAEYEELKSKTLQQIKKKENVSHIKEQQQTEKIRVKILIKHMMKQLKIKPAFIGELLGIARTTVYGYLKEDKSK